MKKQREAIFGGGCFWCIEAVVQRLKGVEHVEPGYTGGNAPGKPTYREVCSGLTGHAEVVKVVFDETVISYKDLITIFMTSHDPTTLNRQGADHGTQYRSAIYFTKPEEKETILQVFQELRPLFRSEIVTEVSPLETFHTAESYHHDYYNNNKEAGYCRAVITPKIAKLRKMYAERLKADV